MSIIFSRLIKQDGAYGPINEKYDPIYEKYYMESRIAKNYNKMNQKEI